MKKFFNLSMILGIASFLLFCILVILLNVDKAVIAESGEPVGLSHINNLATYSKDSEANILSTLLFLATFLIVVVAVVIGVIQLIKRKSVLKVDIDILVFGVFIVFAIIFWLLFDKVVKINVRPIDASEGSFPSTHVFVTVFFLLAGRNLLLKYKDDKAIKYASAILVIVYVIAMCVLRVAAGKHYITDVVGGVLMGLTFYFIMYGIINFIKNKENNKEKSSE